MKKEIAITNATRLINPGGVILVTSSHQQKDNIITLAWHTPISKNPPLLGIAIAKSHFSYGLIAQSKEFAVNIPHAGLMQQVIVCGSVHGNTADKFKEADFTREQAHKLVNTPLIKECIGHIECQLNDIKEIGDHGLFIGEAVSCSAEDAFFDAVWQVDKTKLLFHLGGKFFTGSGESITA